MTVSKKQKTFMNVEEESRKNNENPHIVLMDFRLKKSTRVYIFWTNPEFTNFTITVSAAKEWLN